MNKQTERKQRLSLTLLVLVYIFTLIAVSALISFLAVLLLVSLDMIPTTADGSVHYIKVLNFMLFITILTGFLIAGTTSQLALKYINNIINQMNRLASGDFKARLVLEKKGHKHPTAVEITESFNRMAEELDNTQMLRSDFINNFSHEFKTPIVSIAGFAKLLKYEKLSEEQRREYIDIIEEEALRLSSMATNVLNLTKVENQTILTDITAYNLSEQLRTSVLLLENNWTRKNIEFNLDFDEYQIAANEELLKQVWINILDNAIKFSDEYSEITVKIQNNHTDYEVTISNIGVGISVESQKKIFDKFYQADESHATHGNGIGLAIVKRIVELHNGCVAVESQNNVTTFKVIIPKLQNK